MAPESTNRVLLDEVNAADLWFRARKIGPVWARQLAADETVTTREGAVNARAGDFLCRGEAGDVWPQAAARLAARYDATGDVDESGWRKYVPRAGATDVLAARVDRAFGVSSRWGQLTGEAGDYLVKGLDDRDVAYPEEVWIVGGALFEATYERGGG